MPTYGTALLLAAMRTMYTNVNALYIAVILAATFILTFVIPASIIFYMWKANKIDSLHIEDAKQGRFPYFYTGAAYAFWFIFVWMISLLPGVMTIICLGAIIALVAVSIINEKWKISAHLTGIGGLLGGICSFALYAHYIPMALIMFVLVMALLLMYARLYLNAHSPLQVVAGFLLGLISVFGLTCIIFYA
jgi:membrane-associated phospholipid phosphatase